MPVDSAHDLYGLPLEQFIPERSQLAKALRSEKRKDEATEIAALRKPSVAAWAVNQLVRTQPAQIEALFQAGDALVQAQSHAASGKPAGDAMRDATRRQREAVHELLQAAEGLLSTDGHPLSQTTLERVGDTLRAAAIDPEARREVQDGCLSHELRFVGLGVGGLTASPPKAPTKSKQATLPRRRAKKAAPRATPPAPTARGRRRPPRPRPTPPPHRPRLSANARPHSGPPATPRPTPGAPPPAPRRSWGRRRSGATKPPPR